MCTVFARCRFVVEFGTCPEIFERFVELIFNHLFIHKVPPPFAVDFDGTEVSPAKTKRKKGGGLMIRVQIDLKTRERTYTDMGPQPGDDEIYKWFAGEIAQEIIKERMREYEASKGSSKQ